MELYISLYVMEEREKQALWLTAKYLEMYYNFSTFYNFENWCNLPDENQFNIL